VAAAVGAAGLHCRAAIVLAGAGGCCTVALIWRTWRSLAAHAGHSVSAHIRYEHVDVWLHSLCCGTQINMVPLHTSCSAGCDTWMLFDTTTWSPTATVGYLVRAQQPLLA
jgi:hypothetical protein